MKKILVVGGTGFIGKHLVRHCVKKNFYTFSLSSKKVNKKNKIKKARYIILDIRNKKNIKKLKKIKFDVVVNLGGEVNHRLKKKVIDTHYHGLVNLLNNINLDYLKSFIQIGSSAEYGKFDKKHKKQREMHPCFPESYYGKAKLSATKYLINNKKFNSFSKCVLRLYQVYGPQQKENRIIPFVIKNSLANKFFPCSYGLQTRDFAYISDVISAIFKSISHPKKVDGQIINIGFGKGYKLVYVIKKILSLIGRGKPLYGKVKMRSDEAKKVVPDILKAKKILNWYPKVDLEKGLRLTINSFK